MSGGPGAPKVFAIALTGSDQVIASSRGAYHGFTLRETAGAVARVDVYDHPSAASGTLLDSISLAANESAREWYTPGGLEAQKGIFVDIVSGSVVGSIRVS